MGREIMLDTSAYSALLRGNAKVKDVLNASDRIYLNPVVLGELLSGFRHGNSEKKNRHLLNEFLELPAVRIVDVSQETSEHYAIIVDDLRKKGTPITTNDLWIAASALQYDLTLLTADTDFLKVSQVRTSLIKI